MEDNIVYINIIISCVCSIFYLTRKYCNRNKQSKYTEQIINQINSLGIGDFNINHLIQEIQKILPIRIDDENIKKEDEEKINDDVKIIIKE